MGQPPVPMSEPLLSSSRSSNEFSDDNSDDGLLRKQYGAHKKPQREGDWLKIGLAVWAAVATLGEHPSGWSLFVANSER